MDYYNEEPYYEPTPADEIFFEAKQKLEECLKESVKSKINYITEENIRLKNENEKMKEKVRNIEWKEKALENRENDMERNVLRKKFSEMLKPLEEKVSMYNADYKYVWIDKCDKCDKDRKLKYITPLGKTMYEDCKCKKSYKVWYPAKRKIVTLALYKDKNYPYSVSVTPKYDSASYDDTYCKFELSTYIQDLNDEEMNYDIKELNYRDVGFKITNDCQAYCDYLNEKEKTPNKIVEKFNKEKIDDDDSWDDDDDL